MGAIYSAYNLVIESELELPELRPIDAAVGLSRPPDVRVHLGRARKEELADAKQLGPFLRVNMSSLWLEVPEVGRFLVRNGNEICIDLAPASEAESVRLFLLGSAFGALLFQRGFLVLHGNAVHINNQCLICVGDSGVGKSTLAAGFMARGFKVLADDVVPVDVNGFALPGFPRIKLWQDAADYLKINTRGLRHVYSGIKKYSLPLNQEWFDQPAPIRWIYALETAEIDEIKMQKVTGMNRFPVLYDNTYRCHFLSGMSLTSKHLQLCGRLASTIHLTRVLRPEEGFELDALINRLLLDAAKNP